MKSIIVFLGLAIMISSCDVLSGQEPITQSNLELQLKQIKDFVQTGECDKGDECSYLPIGHKACGGPAGYIVFSNNIDVEALKKMVDKYTEDQKIYNKENNIISDCSIPNPPEKLGCVEGNCVEI